MQTNLAFQNDAGDDTLQDALLRLGERWLVSGAEDFSASFVTQLTSVYGHLLSAWPDGVGPEKSLELLSADIASQLRPTAELFGINTFGLSLSSRTAVLDDGLPFLLVYDLERGLRVPQTEAEKILLPERALWVGYAPLDEEEIEQFLTHQKQREAEIPSEKVLENLQAWQRNFSHTLALAQVDAAMSMEAQTALLGMLKQGRSLQGSVMLAQSKTSTVKNKTDVKAETQKMRAAIVKQLANGALPEPVRASLRLLLKQLDKAVGERPVAWKPKVAQSSDDKRRKAMLTIKQSFQQATKSVSRFARKDSVQGKMISIQQGWKKLSAKKVAQNRLAPIAQQPVGRHQIVEKGPQKTHPNSLLARFSVLNTAGQRLASPPLPLLRPAHQNTPSMPQNETARALTGISFQENTRALARASSRPQMTAAIAEQPLQSKESLSTPQRMTKPGLALSPPPSLPKPVASSLPESKGELKQETKLKLKQPFPSNGPRQSTPVHEQHSTKPDQIKPKSLEQPAASLVASEKTNSVPIATVSKPDVTSRAVSSTGPDPVVTPQIQQTEFKQEPVIAASPTETVAPDFSKVDFQSMGVDLESFSSVQSNAEPTNRTVSVEDIKVASDLQDKTSKAFEAKLSESNKQNTQNEKKGAKDSPHRCDDPFCVCHMAAPGPK